MNLRRQLLLVSLVVLLLPLGAWQFARQIEQTLRDGHAQGLLESAQVTAEIMAAEGPNAWPQATGDVLYVHQRPSAPFLDGHADDWHPWLDYPQRFASDDERLIVDLVASRHRSGLFLLFVTTSPDQVFSTPGTARGDRVQMEFIHPDQPPARVQIAPLAPGWVESRGNNPVGWPGLQGYWQSRGTGWTLEAQIPDRQIPHRMTFTVFDVDRQASARIERQAGSGGQHLSLIERVPALEDRLQALTPAGSRSWAVLDDGWVVAHSDRRGAGAVDADSADDRATWIATWLFEQLISGQLSRGPSRTTITPRLDGPEIDADRGLATWTTRGDDPGILLTVSAPVIVDDQTIGRIIIERNADNLLLESNRAGLRLVGISMGALVLVVLILLGFATLLSERIRRLRNAAERAVAPDGRVLDTLPTGMSGDELADLRHSMSTLLGRLREHQNYLRTLADKLAHELRTPLAMIRSSLDNLEQTRDPEEMARYCRRANEGSVRLNRILQAMSQAARIEESIQAEQREAFDLSRLAEDYILACGQTYPARRFTLENSTAEPVVLHGSPDLFAQLLDKLIDNAVDFSPDNGEITLTIRRRGGQVLVDIENDGPPLPESVADNLFESMVGQRERSEHRDGSVHLGLGLYIARLIAEYHHGQIAVRESNRGCCIRMVFPKN